MKKINNKGISLISLVVTIIVLLILAGVSINLLLNDDGIISKAREAKAKTELAIEEENGKLSMLYTMINNPTEYETSEIVSEAENIINEMQTEISTLQEEKSTLQEEITTKNTQITNLNTQITSLQNQLSVTTAENTEERARLSTQISTLQNEVSNVQSQIATKNTQIADLNTQINNKQTIITTLQTELNDINTVLGELTVESNKMLKDYTAYVNGQLVVGTMPNIGSVSQTLNAGQSYTIPEGYHDGTGVITAASLSNQTQSTATAEDIAEGKTAWVNGEMITGTAEIPTQFQTMEFTMGSGTNNGGASGYRSFITFDSNWFIENVQKIEVKNCNISSTVEIRAAGYRTSAYKAPTTVLGTLSTTANYQEIVISRDFDTTTYPYIYITNSTSASTNAAAAYIKLVF